MPKVTGCGEIEEIERGKVYRIRHHLDARSKAADPRNDRRSARCASLPEGRPTVVRRGSWLSATRGRIRIRVARKGFSKTPAGRADALPALCALESGGCAPPAGDPRPRRVEAGEKRGGAPKFKGRPRRRASPARAGRFRRR